VFTHIKEGKELWDALDAKFGAVDAGSELYIMESFHDFKMTKDLLVVQQAHEIHSLSVPYPTSLWQVALLLSCPVHGGTSPQLSTQET
jgi:hypothetical protein